MKQVTGIYYLLYFLKGLDMQWCSVITEVVKIMALLACVNYLTGSRVMGRGKNTKGYQLMVIAVCLTAKYLLTSLPYLYIFTEMISIIIYIRAQYKRKWIDIFAGALYAVTALDIANIIAVTSTFPVIKVLGIEPYTLLAEILILFAVLIWCTLMVGVVCKMQWKLWGHISQGARLGKLLICMMLEFVFLLVRYNNYDSNDIAIYKILLLGVGFSSIILALWIMDKKEEEQKMRELISYTHKTREVLPTVGRALTRLEELSEHIDKSGELIEELKSICNQDIKDRGKELAALKTFDTTGSTVLDEQLKRYIEEAEEQEFCLDIIVRAPVTDLLSAGKVERYQFIQMLGDLYRNANKIISKKDGTGRILICFGYNGDGFYEISIHDNGESFPKYIMERLGQRGNTTNGTGHGLADIMQVLRRCRGSFVLNQNLDESSVFTKGIRIVFDHKNRLDIHGR